MLTQDPKTRAEVVAEIMRIIDRTSLPEERHLIQSFAPVILEAASDRNLFMFPPEILADRLRRHYQFVVNDMPPANQLFKGLPGIHVSVYNPDEAEARAMGGGAGLPLETTVVRTHTLDAPFIFDSLKNYFGKAGLRVYSALHPIFSVRRQWEQIVSIGPPHEEGTRESYCYLQIEPVDSKERLRRMQYEIFYVLKSVFLAVDDFASMQAFMKEISGRLRPRPGSEDIASVRAFIDWLLDENYVFFGIARYEPGGGRAQCVQDTVTGVFKDPELLPVVFPGLMDSLESRILPRPGEQQIVGIDFSRNASAIYHLEPIDTVVLREWDAQGRFSGAFLLLGRFSRGAFGQRADRIPILKDKIAEVLRGTDAIPNSHVYREMIATFNRMPMRELFYAPPEALKAIIEPIAFMLGDDEIVVRKRAGTGYVVLEIAFSRLRYSHAVEVNIARALADAFGPVSFQATADCGSTNLLLFYFDDARLEREIDEQTVHALVEDLVTTWEDRTAAALEAAFGAREGRRLFKRYVTYETRSGLYREVTPPHMVPDDIGRLERLETEIELRISPRTTESCTLHLYSLHVLRLTHTLKTLQNLGLEVTDEIRIPLALPDNRRCYLYRFEVRGPARVIEALPPGEDRFCAALRRLDSGDATDDALNGLILAVGLTWRQVEALRTVRNHLLQIHQYYTPENINRVLLNNPAAASALFRYFAARFDQGLPGDRALLMREAEREVEVSLEAVVSLAEDEVLRALYNLMRASVRTNFYQVPERPAISIKVESAQVDMMPSPRPLCEIYVHSSRLEGIHLRGGRVARGGIRWSDRPDDFRTEVLGLMATQMLKNTIIVPTGAKGGFYLTGNVPAPPALDAYLVERYSRYISALLDVTDTIVDGHIVHPPEVVAHDVDDPYLVVAADKGTAHLSDTANRIAYDYGFWLDDAFASGGKTGYDHKKMGITARGAWECVKHHFRNLGLDIQKEPFTAVGIGDMSGDVFGNGMLLSPVMKLVAAFDHRHIFIDPEPDMEKSLRERRRLFGLPRSSWRDYDRAAISPGGGVFDRSARSIPLSPEMRRLFGIEAEQASGEELIRRILTAPVDLLYNGGIGTYVKASTESDADAGDRANDRVRVNGSEVRARVVGEGGNRGFTQKARLEYWLRGGLINTDAIDNSGGVDTSDREVNLKILLNLLVKKGVVRSREERNRILAEMEEEVAELVLEDNRGQARALTLDGERSARDYDAFVSLVDEMKLAGVIPAADPQIPTREWLLGCAEKGRGLPRPLLADLLGYTKMWGYGRVIQSALPDSDIAQPFLDAYFPERMRPFSRYFAEHPLRREITATAMVNYVVNSGGISLLPRLAAADFEEALKEHLSKPRIEVKR